MNTDSDSTVLLVNSSLQLNSKTHLKNHSSAPWKVNLTLALLTFFSATGEQNYNEIMTKKAAE